MQRATTMQLLCQQHPAIPIGCKIRPISAGRSVDTRQTFTHIAALHPPAAVASPLITRNACCISWWERISRRPDYHHRRGGRPMDRLDGFRFGPYNNGRSTKTQLNGWCDDDYYDAWSQRCRRPPVGFCIHLPTGRPEAPPKVMTCHFFFRDSVYDGRWTNLERRRGLVRTRWWALNPHEVRVSDESALFWMIDDYPRSCFCRVFR